MRRDSRLGSAGSRSEDFLKKMATFEEGRAFWSSELLSQFSYRFSVFPDNFTSIYKKKSKSLDDFKKSYDNLKLDLENFWDRKFSIFIFIQFPMKIFEISEIEKFRNCWSQNFHWKLYENENRKISISNFFDVQL